MLNRYELWRFKSTIRAIVILALSGMTRSWDGCHPTALHYSGFRGRLIFVFGFSWASILRPAMGLIRIVRGNWYRVTSVWNSACVICLSTQTNEAWGWGGVGLIQRHHRPPLVLEHRHCQMERYHLLRQRKDQTESLRPLRWETMRVVKVIPSWFWILNTFSMSLPCKRTSLLWTSTVGIMCISNVPRRLISSYRHWRRERLGGQSKSENWLIGLDSWR